MRDQRLDLLGRGHPGDDDVAVADTALVKHIVEIQRVALAQRLADRLARGGQNAAMHHIDLVGAHQLLAKLRVERHVRLRVIGGDLDLAAQEAARRIDLLDR